MFVGQYDYKLDSKGRLVIPAKFRDELDREGGEMGLYVTKVSKTLFGEEHSEQPATFLEMYTTSSWEERAQRMKEKAKEQKSSEWFLRKLAWDADFCSLDSQWRINLPDRLIKTAGLEKRVKVVGGIDHIEVWDQSGWQKVNEVLENEAHHLEDNIYEEQS